MDKLNLEKEIEINGCVITTKLYDEWLSDFIEWLESRGEVFGGGTDCDER